MNPKIKSLLQRRSVQIALGVGIVLLLWALLTPNNDEAKVDMGSANLCRVERGDLVVSILQSGELVAKNSRDILNEAFPNAKIAEIVDDGAAVTNGQLLFELESSQLQERYLDQVSDVNEARASLTLARENLEIAKLKNATDLESARLKLDLAEMDLKKYISAEYEQMTLKAQSDIALAEEELKRARSELEGTQELFDKGFANKNDLDSDKLAVQRKEIEVRNKTTDLMILTEYTHAKKFKELNNAVTNAMSALERLHKTITADVQSKQANIVSREARLEIEKKQLETKEEELANTKVYADFDGQVFYPADRRRGKIEKGATVNARQKILSYPDLSAWDLKVGVPEAMIDKVAEGQEAIATLDAVPGLVLRGEVRKISAVPDSQNWFNTGVKTYTIMIDVNAGLNGKLKPGMSATVEVVTDQLRDVLFVPIQSVVSRDDRHYVYVVRRGRKELREVEIGKFNTGAIQILSGLEQDEQLLLYAEVELEADSSLTKSPLSEESKKDEGGKGEA